MSENVTLAQLAAELAQLRQQVDEINQRLDMIYGAVTRLADQKASPKTTPPQSEPASSDPRKKGSEVSMMAMMDPGRMLDALYDEAIKAGLDISSEILEGLKEGDKSETPDE